MTIFRIQMELQAPFFCSKTKSKYGEHETVDLSRSLEQILRINVFLKELVNRRNKI